QDPLGEQRLQQGSAIVHATWSEKPQKKRPFSFRRNERFWRVSLAGFVFPHAWVVRRPQAELQIGANLILPSVQSRLFQEIAPVGRADLDLRGRTAARQRQRDVAAGGPAAPYAADIAARPVTGSPPTSSIRSPSM